MQCNGKVGKLKKNKLKSNYWDYKMQRYSAMAAAAGEDDLCRQSGQRSCVAGAWGDPARSGEARGGVQAARRGAERRGWGSAVCSLPEKKAEGSSARIPTEGPNLISKCMGS